MMEPISKFLKGIFFQLIFQKAIMQSLYPGVISAKNGLQNALLFTRGRQLSGLRPEPRWGAQSAPQTPNSRLAGILKSGLS